MTFKIRTLIFWSIQIWPYLFSVALTYVVTLSLFPAVSVLVYSEHRGRGYVWNGIFLYTLLFFTVMFLLIS